MKAGGLIALAVITSTASWSIVAASAVAAVSPVDAAAQLGQSLVKAVQSFAATADVATIEAQLALVIEQSGVSSDIALQALDIAEAIPGLSPNARTAIENLKRLIKARKRNYIGALGGGGLGGFGSGGPGFAGGGGGADYSH